MDPKKKDETDKDQEEEKEEPTDGGSENEEKQVTYSQKDLDKLFAQRGQQGRTAEQKLILEKAGVKTVEELYQLVGAQKKAKEDELSELDKQKARVTELEARNSTLETNHKTLKRQVAFAAKVRELRLEFASASAEEDAFKALNLDAVGEDNSGLEDEIKRLVKDRAYYFGKPSDQQRFDNDGSAKGKVITRTTTEQAKTAKRKSLSPL